MNRVDLLEPLLEGGIANTNFFNGRLLSAEDLRAEQKASRQQRSQLGLAIGAGVVDGLWVERAAAGGGLLAVAQGSPASRPPRPPPQPPGGGGAATCVRPAPPASEYRGGAATSGLGDVGVS